MVFSISQVIAQNPFELTSRLSNHAVLIKVQPNDTSSMVSANPFDIIRTATHTSATVLVPKPEAAGDTLKLNPNPNDPKPIEDLGVLWVTLLTIVPVTLLFMLFRIHFNRAYQNIFNFNILQQSYREFKGSYIVPGNLWYLSFWINGGILITLVSHHLGFTITQHIFTDALLGIMSVSGLLLLKHSFNRILQQIFVFSKELKLYNYLSMLFGTVLSVLLVPVNLVLMYSPEYSVVHILMYASGLFLVAALLFLGLRGIIIGNTYWSMYGFHFLLYICAVEIAPILILVKVGLVFINK